MNILVRLFAVDENGSIDFQLKKCHVFSNIAIKRFANKNSELKLTGNFHFNFLLHKNSTSNISVKSKAVIQSKCLTV